MDDELELLDDCALVLDEEFVLVEELFDADWLEELEVLDELDELDELTEPLLVCVAAFFGVEFTLELPPLGHGSPESSGPTADQPLETLVASA